MRPVTPVLHRFLLLKALTHRGPYSYVLTTRDLQGGGGRADGQILSHVFFSFFPIERSTSSISLSVNFWPVTAARQKL